MREMPYSRMPSGQILNTYGINLNSAARFWRENRLLVSPRFLGTAVANSAYVVLSATKQDNGNHGK